MNLLVRASAMLLLASLVGLLILRTSPELSLLLSFVSVTAVFILAASVAEE